MNKLLSLPLTLLLLLLPETANAAERLQQQAAAQPLVDRQWSDWQLFENVNSKTGRTLPTRFLTGQAKQTISQIPFEAATGTEAEEKKATADRLFDESLNLWRASRWPLAFEKLEQALILYREIDDYQSESRTLIGLGAVSDNLGQYPQALDYYEQALVIIREIGDRTGEGTTSILSSSKSGWSWC